jgi:hypothetical protein
LGGLAADIAVNGQVEIVTGVGCVEARVDKERDELQMQGIRIADVLVQAIVEVDKDGRDLRRQGGVAAEGQRRRKRPESHLAVLARSQVWSTSMCEQRAPVSRRHVSVFVVDGAQKDEYNV